jgi:hypothetical protein
MPEMTAAETTAAEVTAAMAATEVTATVHSAAAATMATAVHGAGRGRGKHGKAERSARGDGQKCGLTKHGTLLCDPFGT